MNDSGILFQEKFGTLTGELNRMASRLEAYDVSLVGPVRKYILLNDIKKADP